MLYLISDYADESTASHSTPRVDLIEDDGRLGIFVNDELIESYTEDSETPIGKVLQRLTTIRDLAEKGLLG